MIFDKYILSRSLVLAGADCVCTSDSCYITQNEQENRQNNVIEGYIIRDMDEDIDRDYQEKGETAANTILQPKKISDQ